MVEPNNDSGVIKIQEPRQRADLVGLLDHPLVKEFGIPLAKQAIKKELGINTADKEVSKKPFSRFMYTLKDFIQGTWWIVVLMTLSMGLVVIVLLWIRKMAGV